MAFVDEYYDHSDEAKWYVAHTYSGYENKVKTNLEKIVENRGIGDKIVDVRVPVETVIEIDDGKEKQVENKIFPSYVLVKMVMTDETWHVVRNISGVTGFVGPGSKPIPLSDEEVEAIGVEESATKRLARCEVGSTVEMIGGPFKGNRAKVEKMSIEDGRATVLIDVFGRETVTDADIKDIKLAE